MKNESLLSSDVPDPSDFPPNEIAPGLRSLDRSLRCMICGELFDAPVTLACGHCFCSLCVRTAMAEKQECPGCRKATVELHIRPNPVMEEVLAAWKLSRPYILELSHEDKQRRFNDSSTLATPNPKKRKIAPEGRVGKRKLKDFTASSSSLGRPSAPLKPTRNRKLSPEDDDLEMTTIPTSDVDDNELDTSADINPRTDDHVPCPICNKSVKFKIINFHIDSGCKDTPPDSTRSKKSEWAKIMSSKNKGKQKESDDTEAERLPKVSYGTLKDKRLKEMLAEYNVATHGDRNLLIQRHQRWVMLFNANLDRSPHTRESKHELRKELRKWEDEKVKKKKNVEDGVAHEKLHKAEFDQLVKVARGKKAPPRISSGRGAENAEKPSPFQQSSAKEDTIVVDSEQGESLVESC